MIFKSRVHSLDKVEGEAGGSREEEKKTHVQEVGSERAKAGYSCPRKEGQRRRTTLARPSGRDPRKIARERRPRVPSLSSIPKPACRHSAISHSPSLSRRVDSFSHLVDGRWGSETRSLTVRPHLRDGFLARTPDSERRLLRRARADSDAAFVRTSARRTANFGARDGLRRGRRGVRDVGRRRDRRSDRLRRRDAGFRHGIVARVKVLALLHGGQNHWVSVWALYGAKGAEGGLPVGCLA